ncbi:MAG: hypothetical protein EOP49_00480, partial [Sphingobacteriales bacterium]
MKTLHSFKFLILLLPLLWSGLASAQVQNCTNHLYANGNSTVTFNVSNTNTDDILLTEISTMMSTGLGGNYTYTLLYNTTAVASSGATWTQGTIDAGQNGWVVAGTGSAVLPAHTTPQTVITGLTLTIPAGATYGFALTSNGTLGYESIGSGVNNFTNAGVSLITGDNIGWGGPALPASPGNYPRGWSGCISWITSVPCAGTPALPVAAAPAGVCPSVNFNLSSTGATVGAGISYVWEWSPAGAGSWTALPNATSTSFTVVGGITSSADYRLITTCANGGGSTTSNIVTVNVNAPNQCYCTPTYTNGGGTDNITNVVLGTLSNNTDLAGNPTPFYTNYSAQQPGTLAIPDLEQGMTYQASVTFGTHTTQYHGIWIDYNQNGLFEATEFQTGTPNPAGASATALYTITVPLTALPGQTRMRVRGGEDASFTGTEACTQHTWGEAEDYLVNIVVPVPCAGQPAAVTVSGPASVCTGTPFSMTAANATTGTGISYDWQYFDGTNWVSTGGTNLFYTVATGITAATDYRLVTTCSNGGGQDISNTLTVGMSSFNVCYCSPLTGTTLHSSTGSYITNVNIPGTTLNNTTTTAGPGGYTQYSPTVVTNTATLDQGIFYTLNTTLAYTGYYAGAWIDYDHSGTYDATEYIPLTVTGLNGTGSFTVPYSSTPGVTGMRVRMHWSPMSSTTGPCADYGYETEEYLVDIIQAFPCTGTPNTPNAAGPASGSACPGANFTLEATGYSTGLGISYEWQYFDGTNWIATPGTTPIYTVSGGITAPTDYRFVTNCSNGGGQSISNTVNMAISGFIDCYCPSSPFYTFDGEIYNVTLGALNNTSTCLTTGGPGSQINQYSNYTATVAATPLMQTATYPLSVTAGACNGFPYPAWVKVWIDFDQDGSFSGVGEEVFSGTTTSGNYTPAGDLANGNITIPLSATTGLTRMRVVLWQETSGSPVTACQVGSPYNYGETEDYFVDILPAVACTGTPDPVTASGPATVCAGSNFTLTAAGASIGSGITYEWQSFDGTNWNGTGGTTTAYTVSGGITAPTDYRFVTTCANGGGQDISNTFSISLNAPSTCYCTPVYTNFGGGDNIVNVVLGTLSNNTAAAANPAPAYVNYTTQQPGTLAIPDLQQSATHVLTLTFGTDGNQYYGVWVDFDQNGIFATSEHFTGTPANAGGNGTVNVSINVPLTATLGNTRMRIRGGEDASMTSAEACSTHTWGEAEDYLVNIVVPPTCQAPGSLNAAVTTSGSADISWAAVTGATAYEYAITNSVTAPASGTTTTGNTVTGATYTTGSTVYYLHVRTECGTGTYSTWNTLSFMPSNNATGATTLTTNAGCTGNPYTNIGSNHGATEPYASCNDAST